MMANNNRYFQKFPYVNYNDTIACNLMRRVNLNDNVKSFYTAFYPHTMQSGDRIDHVAFNYYDDVNFDWLIYHANDVIDPFYDVHLSTTDFERYIIKKYGTLRTAIRKVIKYRNNWRNDDTILSSAAYNSLPASQKKYWNPLMNAFGNVGYDRAEIDFYASTNKIESFDFASESSGNFIAGENIVRDDDSESIAEVTWANTTSCVIQHVIGDFTSNTNYTVTGEQSGVTATVNAGTHLTIQNVIPEEEQVYYSRYTAYDEEFEENEAKRDIYLVDNVYSDKLNKQLSEILE